MGIGRKKKEENGLLSLLSLVFLVASANYPLSCNLYLLRSVFYSYNKHKKVEKAQACLIDVNTM